jgi:hypothetical protein
MRGFDRTLFAAPLLPVATLPHGRPETSMMSDLEACAGMPELTRLATSLRPAENIRARSVECSRSIQHSTSQP